MKETPRIAIVGGGPGGLLAARVLHRHGIAATVYDADTAVDSRDPGGTLDLHADSGQIALEDAGLLPAFHALARAEGQAMTRRDHHGTLLKEFVPADGETSAPEIDRGQLRTMLAEQLAPGTVHWGHKLTELTTENGVHRLHFADGSTVESDVVIGADGTWSKVRRRLTDAMPEYLGVSFLDVRFDNVENRHPGIAALVGDGQLFATDGAGRAVIVQRNSNGIIRGYVAFRAEEDWAAQAGVDLADRESVREFLLREFHGWDLTVRPLLTDNDGDYVARAFTALPAPLTWQRVPGITVLGDAAHAMAPFGGHGANLALLDGAELAHALHEEPTVEAALTRYETAMFARTGHLAAASNEALRGFFADQPDGGQHEVPDREEELRAYETRAAEYRASRTPA
ncbi:FAD-dependent oxidoreductase [Amycolatopsis silviterrae]|uniref:Flavin-dependent monooxygenase n=1 Tax=Amycolatopsis silviterrae TaxID=1656914 RepID=A0ABW5HKF4_9PSEU